MHDESKKFVFTYFKHIALVFAVIFVFFFYDTATTEIYTSVNTLSLHDALPIYDCGETRPWRFSLALMADPPDRSEEHTSELQSLTDISYAVFCLKKKKIQDGMAPQFRRGQTMRRSESARAP